jgi:HEXXH motif-containing protein
VKLFDNAWYDRLNVEFQRSTLQLLGDLCDQLDAEYAGTLDTALFRRVAGELPTWALTSWKAVGWVEELNDCVYFLDALARVKQAGRKLEDVTQEVFAECEEQFYENSYFLTVFPTGNPASKGLAKRLQDLSDKLGRQVTQEALMLMPGSVHELYGRTTTIPLDLSAQFERAEPAGALAMGLDGGWLVPPKSLAAEKAKLVLSAGKVMFKTAKGSTLLASELVRIPAAGWRQEPPRLVAGFPHFSLGPAILFDKDKNPAKIVPTPANVEPKVRLALGVIEHVWPEGFANLQRFTTHIIPIKAAGVVSYTYRNRPQITFINSFDRNQLDMVDDLIHENAHHHMNLLLRKFEMRRGDHNQQLFYSPWRQALRSTHGILHAAFTFTQGARLFERISSAAGTKGLPRELGLSAAEVARARYRCMEEVASVKYSIHDLRLAAGKLGFLTAKGKELVEELAAEIESVERGIKKWNASVLKGPHAKDYQEHLAKLAQMREHYRIR